MDRIRNSSVRGCLSWLKENALLVTTMMGIVLGLVIGVAIRGAEPSETALMLIGFPGEIFLRLLKMMVLPLIIASIVSGTTALDPRTHGRMAVFAVSYFIMTSLISAILGVFLVLVIHPGHPDIKESVLVKHHDVPIKLLDTFTDLIRNCLPTNLISACLHQTYTVYKYEDAFYTNETGFNSTIQVLERGESNRDQMNVLGLIVFFMAFGSVLSTMGEKGQIIAQYFFILNKIIMIMVKLAIWFTPIGVASIICEKMASLGGKTHLLEDLVLYVLTVFFGLAIHQFILLPALYYAVIRQNPFRFYWNLMQAILTGFASESSAVALPVTIQNMEDKNNADKHLTKFILPIGATINMDGTAMFVAIASIFIAQTNNHEASVAEIITIIFTSTAVSVASSATPGAALFLMVMTLSVLPNVPIEDIRLLLIIDWLLGRCRTTNNIVGDCYAVALFQHWYKDELVALTKKENEMLETAHPFLKH